MDRAFVSLLAWALWGAAAHAQPDPRSGAALQQVGEWRESVVLITIRCPGMSGFFTGSGVVVSEDGLVLTAAHVGSVCPDVSEARMGAVRSPYGQPGEELSARRVARVSDGDETPDGAAIGSASRQDLALWRIENMSGSGLRPARLAQGFPVPGEAIIVVGFSALPYAPYSGQAGLTVNRLWLSSVAASDQDLPLRLHYAGTALPGASGGPVFNAAGEVIGIHSSRFTANLQNLIQTGCTPDQWGNCASVGSGSGNQATVGVNYFALKSVLDNYGWATSVHAVPEGWLQR